MKKVFRIFTYDCYTGSWNPIEVNFKTPKDAEYWAKRKLTPAVARPTINPHQTMGEYAEREDVKSFLLKEKEWRILNPIACYCTNKGELVCPAETIKGYYVQEIWVSDQDEKPYLSSPE